jgi:putative salt-induced outer membrane protein YdiY
VNTIMRMCILLLVTLLLGWAASLQADVLRLKNGDVIHGTWERVVGGSLVFKTDVMGEITVDVSKIQSLETTMSAVAALPKGTTVKGKLEVTPQGKWQLIPKSPASAPAVENFVAAYPQKNFAKVQQTLHAKPWQDWNGITNLGYSLITGDTQSRSFNANVNATHNQPDIPGMLVKWRSNFSLTALFSHAKSSSSAAEVTSNTFSSGLRQDRFFGSNNFVFAVAQYDYIQPQGIKLRQTYGGGFGRDMFHRPKFDLSLLGGLTYVRTNLENTSASPLPPGTSLLQNSAEVLLGEKLSAKLTKWLNLEHDVNFYPNVTQTGEYRFDTATALAVPLTKRLSFSVSFVDFYLSNPLPNNHKNNATLSTGLGIRF